MEKILTPEETKEKALRLLEFRSHSEQELRQKLIRAGGSEIDAVIDFCFEYKLLDDAEYAIRLARNLAHLKKYGKRRISEELKMKGISSEIIENALLEAECDEYEMLLPQMEKKLKGNFDKKNVDKAIRYFLYRGYEFSDIKACMENLRNDAERN